MTDLSSMSDEELRAIASGKPAQSNLSSMSDEELQQIASGGQKKPFSLTGALAETWPAKLAKSAFSAATLPGDVYQGKAAVPQSENMGPETTANLGRVTDLAGLATPMAPRVAPSLTPGVAPTAAELKGTAAAGYEQARGLGVDINSSAVKNLAETVALDLEKDGINGKLAPKTFSIIGELKSPPEGSVATLANLETARRSLGHAAGDFLNPTEKLAASRAIQHLDDYLANIPQGDVLAGDASQASKILGEARGNYAAAQRAKTVGKAEVKAGRQAGSTGSGGNIDNALRQQYKAILNSDSKSRGFNAAELAQMDRIVGGTKTGNAARLVGKFAPTGIVSAALSTGTGFAAGGLPGAVALPWAGLIGKALGDHSTKRQVGKLNEMVRSRSPLADALAAGPAGPVPDGKQTALIRALLPMLSQSRN